VDAVKRQLFMPLKRPPLDNRPQTLVGYTADGHVGFTVAGIELVNKIELTGAEADELFAELCSATCHASRAHDEATGKNEWVTRPIGGGLIEVRYRGERAAFRQIVNGVRRRWKKFEGGYQCTACKKVSEQGNTMFVPVKKGEAGFIKGGVKNWGFAGVRICNVCAHPELAGAIIAGVGMVMP